MQSVNVRMSLAVGIALLILAAGTFAFLPAMTTTASKKPAQYGASIEDGQYLAYAGNCSSCHTAENGRAYGGGVEFHTPFGLLYSTNITPDPINGIGAWSFQDFYASMKQGIRPDGSHLYPAFPYTDFAKMTDKDIASLYLYLQTLTPVSTPNRDNALRFPFNQRALLGPWKKLFHNSDTFTPEPSQSKAWNRGAYLVEGPGHCGACHSPRNMLGAERGSMALTGGTYRDKVVFGYYRQWSGVNLTPHQMGLGSWTQEDLIAYLRDGISRNAVVHGPMREVVLNSTQYLSEEDLRAVAAYLKNIPSKAQASGPLPSEETLIAGEVGYTVHCGSCHLPTGEGSEGLGVRLVDNPIVQAPDPASLINVILYGPHLPPRMVVDRSRMKMYGKRLSDVDIASIASYVRSEFGNNAGAVDQEQVNVQR